MVRGRVGEDMRGMQYRLIEVFDGALVDRRFANFDDDRAKTCRLTLARIKLNFVTQNHYQILISK